MNFINFAKKKIITLTVLVSVLLLSIVCMSFSLKTVSAEGDENTVKFVDQVDEIAGWEDHVGGIFVDYTTELDANIEKSDLKRSVTAERDLDADDVDFETCSFIKSLPYAGVSYVQVDDYEGYLENIYAFSQATQRGDGLVVEEDQELAYVVSAFYVGDYENSFANFVIEIDGDFLINEGKCLIQVSCDNEHWVDIKESDVAAEIFGVDIDLTQYVAGSKYIYVRIAFKNALIKGLNKVDYFFSKTLILNEMDNLMIDFSNVDVQSLSENKNLDGEFIKGLISAHNVKIEDNKLTSNDGGWTSLIFKIDGGNDPRVIKQIIPQFNLTFPAEINEGDQFLNIEMSFDNGINYNKVVSEDDYKLVSSMAATSVSYATVFDGGSDISLEDKSDIEGVVEELSNNSSVLFKISFKSCFVNNIDIKVVFNFGLDERVYSYKIFDLNGGVETADKLNPIKSGCKFVGWYCNGVKADPQSSEFSNGEFVFVAKWKTIQHNVTYVLNGGRNSKINISTITENEFIILGDAIKEGKAFAGWYDKDGNKVTKLEGSKILNDLVLYAVYTDYIDDEGGCAGSFDAIYLTFVLVPTACVLVFIRARRRDN